MATTDTIALSNEIRTLYDADYMMAAQNMCYWDQFSDLRIVMDGQRGRTYEFPIVESAQPATGVLNELEDVVPQQMRANAIQVSLNEYGGAIELTRFLAAVAYTDVHEQAAFVNGYQLAESLDMMARAVAGQGSRVFFPQGVAARTALDKAQATHRATPAFLELLHVIARGTNVPLYEDGSLCTVVHPFVLYDMLQNSGIRDMAIRQTPEMLFNGELAYWSGIRFIAGPSAKAFWGAGAVDASAVATTLAAANQIGDTNLKLTAVTNVDVGDYIAILDATEPGNVWSDTNEMFRVTAVGTAGAGGTGVDGYVLATGPNDGGMRYAHPSGTTVTNRSSAFPIVLLGPNSILKACSDLTGAFGETVITGPFDRLGRFITFGWYLIAGWGRTRNGWLMRGEVASSQL